MHAVSVISYLLEPVLSQFFHLVLVHFVQSLDLLIQLVLDHLGGIDQSLLYSCLDCVVCHFIIIIIIIYYAGVAEVGDNYFN